MAKEKPTTGPIVVDERDGHFYLTADRSVTDIEGVGIAYKRADAILFAAASDLLEALKFAGPQLEILHRHYSGDDAAAIYKVIGIVKSAIGKAEAA